MRTQRSREEVDNLIAEYFDSGITIKEFCKNRGINSGTFKWWLKRQRNSKEASNRTPFVKINTPQLPVTRKLPESEFIIDFPSGARLRWRGTELPSQITHLLERLPAGV